MAYTPRAPTRGIFVSCRDWKANSGGFGLLENEQSHLDVLLTSKGIYRPLVHRGGRTIGVGGMDGSRHTRPWMGMESSPVGSLIVAAIGHAQVSPTDEYKKLVTSPQNITAASAHPLGEHVGSDNRAPFEFIDANGTGDSWRPFGRWALNISHRETSVAWQMCVEGWIVGVNPRNRYLGFGVHPPIPNTSPLARSAEGPQLTLLSRRVTLTRTAHRDIHEHRRRPHFDRSDAIANASKKHVTRTRAPIPPFRRSSIVALTGE